jgi:hypothetical protein
MNSASSHRYELDRGTPGKIDDHLVMFQSLAVLDRPRLTNNAVMAIAHRATWQPLKCFIPRGCTRPRFRQSLTRPESTLSCNGVDNPSVSVRPATFAGARSSSDPSTEHPASARRRVPRRWQALTAELFCILHVRLANSRLALGNCWA